MIQRVVSKAGKTVIALQDPTTPIYTGLFSLDLRGQNWVKVAKFFAS